MLQLRSASLRALVTCKLLVTPPPRHIVTLSPGVIPYAPLAPWKKKTAMLGLSKPTWLPHLLPQHTTPAGTCKVTWSGA
jgi:hypothetical protein